MSYLTDEELKALIENVENNHMLQAPAYLADEIIAQAAEQDEGNGHTEIQTSEAMNSESQTAVTKNGSKQSRMSAKHQLLLYSIEVWTAAAAAILIMTVSQVSYSTGKTDSLVPKFATSASTNIRTNADKVESSLDNIRNKRNELRTNVGAFVDGLLNGEYFTKQ